MFYRLNKSCYRTCQLIFLFFFFRCYLNCKPRVATSLMMSIRVKCTTCSRDDEKRAVYRWNLVEYDPTTKATRAIKEWENWLETGQAFPHVVSQIKNFACLALAVRVVCFFYWLRNKTVGFRFFCAVYLFFIVYFCIYL